MGKELTERIEEISELINKHPGFIAHINWNSLNRMYTVYNTNRVELKKVLALPRSNHELAIEIVQNVGPTTVRDAYTNEILRQIHNYLAAMFTLIAQTRKLSKKYAGTSFKREYDLKVNAMSENPVHRTLQDIRDYFLHEEVPPLIFTGTLGTKENKFTVGLHKKPLLQSSIHSITRKYLNSCEDSIDLVDLINSHAGTFKSNYEWFFSQYTSLHDSEIKDVNSLIRKRAALIRGQYDNKDEVPL